MYKVESQKTVFTDIAPDKKVKVTFSDNYAEIKVIDKEPVISNYRRMPGKKYCNLKTGEIKDFSDTNKEKKLADSRRKTFINLQQKVFHNFQGNNSEVFLTLGYDFTMSDTSRLNKDFNSFKKKLNSKFPKTKSIAVVEYNGNRSLHLHILLKSGDNKRLFIDRDELIQWWGQKNVYVKGIRGMKGLNNLVNYMNPFVNHKKYSRLFWYEPGFQIVRSSQNLIKEDIKNTDYETAVNILESNNYKRYAASSYDIIATTDNKSNIKLNTIKKISFTRRNYK